MSKDRFTRGWEGFRHKGRRLGTLWADCDAGEGDVTLLLDGMCNESALFRLDVLQDWIGLLQREYDITLEEFHAELKAIADRKNKNEISF